MMSTAADSDADYHNSDADYHNSDGSVMPDVLAKGREACYKVQPSATSLRSSAP
jgi:cytochrome c oxidase assembly factor 6